jgi:HYR domain
VATTIIETHHLVAIRLAPKELGSCRPWRRGGPQGYQINFPSMPTAIDIGDPLPVVSCERPSGSTFPVGVTHVLCPAADRYGNDAGLSFQVITLPDTHGPTVQDVGVATGPSLRSAKGARAVQILISFSESLRRHLGGSCRFTARFHKYHFFPEWAGDRNIRT